MKLIFYFFVLLLFVPQISEANSTVWITVIAEDTKGRPIKDVRFSFINTGILSKPTLAEGRTRVALSTGGVNPGQTSALRVSKIKDRQPDWVFISPWDSRVMIPANGEVIKVVLARRGDREALESGDGAKVMAQSILFEISKQNVAQQSITEEQRRRVLAEQANRFGLSDVEIQKAIAAWKAHPQDSYGAGIAAMYERNYPDAIAELKKSLAMRTKRENTAALEVAESAYFLGTALYEQGRYSESADNYQVAADRRPDDADTLSAYGRALLATARYSEAKTQLTRALDVYTKGGPDNLDVARILNNLGVLSLNQGKYAEAESFFKRSLVILEKVQGASHPDVANSLNNLAALLDCEGKYKQAQPLFERALSIWEKSSEKDSGGEAMALNNLALLYYQQGEYVLAERLYKRSQEMLEKTLGVEHPDVASSLNNLALLFSDQAMYTQAEPLFKRSLLLKEKFLGDDHPDVAQTLNNLAELYRKQGLYAQAESLCKHSLAILERAFGTDHPDVANSLDTLALVSTDQKRYTEAESLFKRSLSIREKVLGTDHPDVAVSLRNLAELYSKQELFVQAEPLYIRSLTILEKVLGPGHPKVATAVLCVATVYKATGREKEGKVLEARAKAIEALGRRTK